MSETFRLVATSAFGLESVVARELYRLGYHDTQTENGRVAFDGDAAAIARCNMWLRSADRLLIEVGRFHAETFDELFEGVRALPWERYIARTDTFPVTGKAVSSRLMSVPDCQAITKKAVVERLKSVYNISWFEESGPTVKIEVGMLRDIATITIDTSGAGLHKRGYRKLTAAAPLRETLAAALVQLSRWHPDRVLADPLCGSGTIPVEAAMIATDRAPGLTREFAAEGFSFLNAAVFAEARSEANDRFTPDRSVTILGYDRDPNVLSLARYHAKSAGVRVHFQQQELKDFRSSHGYGFIITNPPYGERLGDAEEAAAVYRTLGRLKKELVNWGVFAIAPQGPFEKQFGARADVRRKLYNGRIACQFYQYLGPKPPWLLRGGENTKSDAKGE